MTDPRRTVVYISGPVASGKTTLASNLAQIARARGIRAAAIDIDDVVWIVAGPDWSKVTREDRLNSWRLAGAMLLHLLTGGFDFIALAGSTVSSGEPEEVLNGIGQLASPSQVRLRISVDEAVRRASADPMRGATRDPAVVRRLHAAADRPNLRGGDFEVNTGRSTADEVAEEVWAYLTNS